MYTANQIIEIRKKAWESHKSISEDTEFTFKVAEMIIESEQLREEIYKYPELLIEMIFVIVDKKKQTTPFFLNTVQHEFLKDLNIAIEQFSKGEILSVKFLVLKGRQQGFTTFITAYQLACTITRKNFSGFTIADSDDNSRSIFQDKAKFVHDKLPELLKPSEKFNNAKELLFDKINSSWRVATATKKIGRSKTINFLHGSESAFWDVLISDIQSAIGEALTQSAIQILESTANGYNEFKDAWDSGKWINKFYQWWKTPEYRQRFESDQKEKQFKENIDTLSGWIWERLRWLKSIGIDCNQLYWYFNKYDSYLNKDIIKQEYPCTEDEAFLSSGNCVFDKENIIQRKEYLKRLYEERPPKRGRFSYEWNDPESRDKIKIESIKWVDDLNGFITIYEDVKNGYPYVIGGDTKGEGKDYFAGTVINNVTGVRCATLHLQSTNSKPYTWQMYCLGYYFNRALVGIEMNFNTAPIEELQRLNYPSQYMRRQYDKITKKIDEKFGWKTDGNTRPLIIDKEIDLIENNIDLFTDITTLDEALTFVYDKDNRPDAQSGKHDDLLISDMISNEIRSQQRFIVSEESTSNKPKLINNLIKTTKKGVL